MEDFRNETYSYLHLQMLFSPPFRNEVEAGQLPSINEMGVALFFSDLAESLYELAQGIVQKACASIAVYGYDRHADKGQQALRLLEGYREELIRRK